MKIERFGFILGLLFGSVIGLSLAAASVDQLESALKKDPDNITVRERLARQFSNMKQWDKVIEHLNPHTDVASPRGYLLLATAYQEVKNFKSVARVLRLLSEKRPKDYHIQFMLGDALIKQAGTVTELTERQKLEASGIESFRAAIRIKRTFRPPYQALVNYFVSAGMNLEAREQINDMLKVFGNRPELHADLCRLYALDGFLQQAVRYCNRARQLNADLPESYIYLAQAYFDQKEMERAEQTLIEAAKRFPRSEFVQYGTGQFFLQKSNFPVAMKYLKRAVASQSGSARSQLALAKSLFESGLEEESLAHFSKACQIETAAQSDVLAAASRLRLKGSSSLAARFSQAAGACKRP